MSAKHVVKLLNFIAVAAAGVALTGCGDSSQPKPAANVKTETSIFISAKDCAESGKLPIQRCSELIDAAIANHLANAKTHLSMRACEAEEGVDRCERTGDRSFRPRLIAFAVSVTGPTSTAIPVYILNSGKETGFRNGKQNFLLTDDNLVVSKKSLAVYESMSGQPG